MYSLNANHKVSVIIPTHNRGESLITAIQSVLSQTYQNIELIIVDDASTDNTEILVRSISDTRLVYAKLEFNRGANFARNHGITLASGDYIAFQDSDDEWLPTKLEKQIKILDNNSDISFVFTAFRRVKNGSVRVLPINVPKSHSRMLYKLLKGNFISTQTVIVRRDFFTVAGVFDEKLLRLQDWDLFIRGLASEKAHFIHEPLVNVFYTSDSISANNKLFLPALCFIYEKYEYLFKEYNLESWMTMRIASAYYTIDKKTAIKWFILSIKKQPCNLILWMKVAYYLSGLASLRRHIRSSIK